MKNIIASFKFRYQKEEVELQIVPAITISEANLDRLIELPQILAKVRKTTVSSNSGPICFVVLAVLFVSSCSSHCKKNILEFCPSASYYHYNFVCLSFLFVLSFCSSCCSVHVINGVCRACLLMCI